MATQTAHFELEKPSQTDVVDVAVLNNNFDDIDVVMFANQERSKAAVSNAADAYDATKTYAVDALVIYENQLYKCITAITTAEQWDSTKWAATTLAEEIGNGGGGGGNADLVHCTQAEYDALPASKLSDDKIYMITDVTQAEAEGEIYSTSERIVGKWIDGSDLYEKTIDFACANTSDVQTAFTFTDEEVKVIKSAYFANSNGDIIATTWVGLIFWDYVITNSVISVKRTTSDSNWQSGVHFVIVIQYTKATS